MRIHGALQDVTELVNAERQLRETRDFFELTLNAVPMPIAYVEQTERERTVTYANKAMEDWLGLHALCADRAAHQRSIRSGQPSPALQQYLEKVEAGETVQVRMSGVRAGLAREWVNYFVPQLGSDRRAPRLLRHHATT